jgi:hypothetical protein
VTVFVAIYWVYCVAYAFGQYKFVSDKEGSLVSRLMNDLSEIFSCDRIVLLLMVGVSMYFVPLFIRFMIM